MKRIPLRIWNNGRTVCGSISYPELVKLAAKTVVLIAKTYYRIGNTELPSILTQLKQKHNLRRKVDMAFLKIFGYDETDARRLLDQIYELLSEEIIRLKIFMKEN